MKITNFTAPSAHFYTADLNYYNEQGNYIQVAKLIFIPANRTLMFESNYEENVLKDFDHNFSSGFFHMVMETLTDDLTSRKMRKYAHRNPSLMIDYVEKHTEYLANEFRFTPLQKH